MGLQNTLRIDEPLHFMFLVAYLITYFCVCYLLFICFKHCRRIWRRKPRPNRIRNVAELVNNFHSSHARTVRTISSNNSSRPAQVQVSMQQNGVCSELYLDGDASSISEEETNTSRISPLFFSPIPRRLRGEVTTQMDQLPSYDSVSEDGESPPPSYDECVLSKPRDNKRRENKEKVLLPGSSIV